MLTRFGGLLFNPNGDSALPAPASFELEDENDEILDTVSEEVEDDDFGLLDSDEEEIGAEDEEEEEEKETEDNSGDVETAAEDQEEKVETEVTAKQTDQPTGHQIDKGLQRLQQDFASFKKKLASAFGLDAGDLADAKPAEKDELDLLAESDPDSVDPYSGTKVLAQKAKQLIEERKVLLERFERLERAQAEREAREREADSRRTFATENPDLDYDEAVEKTRERLRDYLPTDGSRIPEATWQRLVDREWRGVVSELKSSRVEATEDAAPVTKTKKKGSTTIVPKGGKTAPTKTTEIDEETLIDGIFADLV